MKRNFLPRVYLLLGLASAWGLIDVASAATVTNNHGTICTAYAGVDAGSVQHTPFGTSASSKYLTCPLSRRTTNSNGAYVYVDVSHGGASTTTTCSAYSYNYNGGGPIASHTLSWTGTGFHSFALDLSGAGKSNFWSDYSVWCFVGSSAYIYGVDLSEL